MDSRLDQGSLFSLVVLPEHLRESRGGKGGRGEGRGEGVRGGLLGYMI